MFPSILTSRLTSKYDCRYAERICGVAIRQSDHKNKNPRLSEYAAAVNFCYLVYTALQPERSFMLYFRVSSSGSDTKRSAVFRFRNLFKLSAELIVYGIKIGFGNKDGDL